MPRGHYNRGTPEERFWPKIDKNGPSGCWVWCSSLDGHGYGQFRVGGKWKLAHRFAYELVVGPIPVGLELDHICHNTKCVNPTHLRPCTASENHRNSNLDRRNTSGFKGASWHKRLGKWQASIFLNGKIKYLGYYTTPNSAHVAYRNAARTYYGEFANFGEGSI